MFGPGLTYIQRGRSDSNLGRRAPKTVPTPFPLRLSAGDYSTWVPHGILQSILHFCIHILGSIEPVQKDASIGLPYLTCTFKLYELQANL